MTDVATDELEVMREFRRLSPEAKRKVHRFALELATVDAFLKATPEARLKALQILKDGQMPRGASS
jgi:hypothetical protein